MLSKANLLRPDLGVEVLSNKIHKFTFDESISPRIPAAVKNKIVRFPFLGKRGR